MSDIMNIGKSGMLAYRTALAITSENVANADTDGYSRRTVMTAEASGNGSDPFSNSTVGKGVLIDEVRRAFDALVVGQVRDTGSAVASAETMLPAMEQLENRMLPDANGVNEMLSGFFDAVEGLASMPEDRGMRSVLLEAGGGLTAAVADMASDIGDLGDYLHAQGSQVLERVNSMLQEMAKLQDRMGLSSVPGADNAVMDRRDQMLSDLSDLVDISVSYNDIGTAVVRLGSNPGGPVLLDTRGAARITLNADLSLNVRPATAGADPSETVTRAVSGGQLHGLASALSAIKATQSDLNSFAGAIAEQMNTIHQSSRGQDGSAGARMFSLNGWEAVPSAHNSGTSLAVAAEIEGVDPPTGPIRLIRDNAAGVWNAYDETNTLIGTGTNALTLDGVSIEITGTPAEGDIITLNPTHGEAQNMRFLLTDADQIASGGAMTVSADVANAGSADLTAAPVTSSYTAQPDLRDILPAGGGTTGLLSDGVVGVIPAAASEVTLASLAGGSTISNIMVFTREGTQIAGPALSAADAASLLTSANGFADGAVYDGSLTGNADNYLGTQLSTEGSDASTAWLRLSNLPAEDLIVVAGPGELEIGGSVTMGNGTEPEDRDVRLEVLDDTTGEVALYDQASGHRLGGGFLDADNQAEIAGFRFSLGAGFVTGDSFDISASASGTGDARGLSALAALRSRDPSSGMGGYQSMLTEIRTEVGGLVAAGQRKLDVASAQHESALAAHQAAAGVDLDTEAASLMKYQQAYQANARIMTVARELFSTLLNSL